MPTITIKSALTAILAGTLLAVASPAIAHTQSSQGSDPKPSEMRTGYSHLKNLKSGKYLQAASTANGAKVTQQTYDGPSTLQQWDIYTFDGYYTFENVAAGKNLGIDGASTAAGAGAIIANGSSDLNQDWTVDWTVYDGDYFALKNRKSGLCLGISGASTSNGARAVQFKCDGSANQGWAW
ncbi:RICIN domain-containing protein [Streptomyces collinus]|uniref:RICIN domain-containing protein n=1 Tax=Streptomyces collinus TaxID=42684 RepID=UPI0033FE9763